VKIEITACPDFHFEEGGYDAAPWNGVTDQEHHPEDAGMLAAVEARQAD
jgi:hypothetical protein